MFTKLFNRREKSNPPIYHPEVLHRKNGYKINVESIMVIDNAGFLLGSYAPDSKKNKKNDDALISMFISAISNFSKELFKRNDGASITINRGEYIISLESNAQICVAFIGQYEPHKLYPKLGKLLNQIETLYVKGEEPNKMDKQNEIERIIKNLFE